MNKSAATEIRATVAERADSFWSQVGPDVFLALIFLRNFISWSIFSSLLPTIEKGLGIGRGQAGDSFSLRLIRLWRKREPESPSESPPFQN